MCFLQEKRGQLGYSKIAYISVILVLLKKVFLGHLSYGPSGYVGSCLYIVLVVLVVTVIEVVIVHPIVCGSGGSYDTINDTSCPT